MQRMGARGARFARDNAIAIARWVWLYFASRREPNAFGRGHACRVQPWTSVTSRSKGRPASATRCWPIASARGWMPQWCSTKPRIRSSPTSTPSAPARLPGAAVLHALAPPAADRAPAERPLQPAHHLRLPVRPRQDLRLPEPRRQRTVHLPAALRAARRGHADAGSRHLPADAHRRAAPPAARA